VDERGRRRAREKYPKANFYKDYREMLEKEKSLDAIDIATPDHHACGHRRHGDQNGQARLLSEAFDP